MYHFLVPKYMEDLLVFLKIHFIFSRQCYCIHLFSTTVGILNLQFMSNNKYEVFWNIIKNTKFFISFSFKVESYFSPLQLHSFLNLPCIHSFIFPFTLSDRIKILVLLNQFKYTNLLLNKRISLFTIYGLNCFNILELWTMLYRVINLIISSV